MSEKRILESLDKIENKQEALIVNVTEIRKDLNYHIEQTHILRAEVAPIRNSHQQILGVLKFLGLVSLLLSIAAGLSLI
jgi:regulator of replication initiation timing